MPMTAQRRTKGSIQGETERVSSIAIGHTDRVRSGDSGLDVKRAPMLLRRSTRPVPSLRRFPSSWIGRGVPQDGMLEWSGMA